MKINCDKQFRTGHCIEANLSNYLHDMIVADFYESKYFVYFDMSEGSYSITKTYQGDEDLIGCDLTLSEAEGLVQAYFDRHQPTFTDDLPF